MKSTELQGNGYNQLKPSTLPMQGILSLIFNVFIIPTIFNFFMKSFAFLKAVNWKLTEIIIYFKNFDL